jgi:hypothetical protein
MYDLDFVFGARDKDDPVGLQGLMFALFEYALCVAMLINQHAPDSISGWSALPEAFLNEPTLTGKYLIG